MKTFLVEKEDEDDDYEDEDDDEDEDEDEGEGEEDAMDERRTHQMTPTDHRSILLVWSAAGSNISGAWKLKVPCMSFSPKRVALPKSMTLID